MMTHVVRRKSFAMNSVVFFVIGVFLFIVGIWLMSDMLVKFLKFFVGLIIFIIGMQMIFSPIRFRYFRG